LAQTVERNPYFSLFFLQGTDGMQTARSSGQLGDRAERWWFKKIMSDEQAFVSKSYYSMTGNEAVTSAFIPMYDDENHLSGIMGADIRLNVLQEIVDKFSTETKYAYIIDGEGALIAHPDAEKVAELSNYLTLERNVLVKDSSGNVVKDPEGNPTRKKEGIDLSDTLSEITKKVLQGEHGFVKYKNIDKGPKIAKPNFVVATDIRPNTPYGMTCKIISTILNIACATVEITLLSVSAFSPSIIRATPVKIANVMICIIFPSTKAINGLLGKRSRMTSYPDGISLNVEASTCPNWKPAPGWMILANNNPIVTANIAEPRIKRTDLTPILLSFLTSCKLVTPSIIEKNTSGTTTILINFKNSFPRKSKNGKTFVAINGLFSPPI
jgi:hypothetical protein